MRPTTQKYVDNSTDNIAIYSTTVLYHSTLSLHWTELYFVSILGRDKGYTIKYNPLPEGVPKGNPEDYIWPYIPSQVPIQSLYNFKNH